MSSGASESGDVEDASRLQSQAVDSFPPEADVMGATLSGNLNVPFRRTPEESLTGWFARVEQPEEFQSSEDHINVDIADFYLRPAAVLGDSGPGPWEDTPHARLSVAREFCDRRA